MNMKKGIALLCALLLLACVPVLAEEVPEMNWADVGNDELMAQGEFQKIQIEGMPAIAYWVPSIMASVDVSGIEGAFKPAALYATEDQSNSIALFSFEIAGLEDYLTMIEQQGGGSDFQNVKVNGVDCVAYQVEADNMECLVYPITENLILSFSFAPANGDEGWDAVKAVIVASIQPLAE